MAALKSVVLETHSGEKGRFLKSLATALHMYRSNSKAYCCCFSLAADTLPMWAAYGANYAGIAIGFRATSMVDVPARIQKVRYIDENTDMDFKTLVLDLAKEFEPLTHGLELNEILAGSSAFAAMTALKHDSWSYEREVRIVHAQRILPPQKDEHRVFSITSLMPDGEEKLWTEPFERQNGGQPVSYLAFPFGRYRNRRFEPAEAIERVILGPKCQLSTELTASMLQSHGFRGFHVVRSDCQIR